MDTSADATREVLRLESLSNNSYNVSSLTLEHVFLRFTESGNTVQGLAGDNVVDKKELITNGITNASSVDVPTRKKQTSYRTSEYVRMEWTILYCLSRCFLLGVISSTAVAVNYRAAQHCNGISLIALWIAHLIFDMQITTVTTVINWGLLLACTAARSWFSPNYRFGAMKILWCGNLSGSLSIVDIHSTSCFRSCSKSSRSHLVI